MKPKRGALTAKRKNKQRIAVKQVAFVREPVSLPYRPVHVTLEQIRAAVSKLLKV